uniref:F-box domain-containing protein n=1 Tax=Acrobeloides nanus TaxID=290746 RepID=A0A914CBN0_9BILA
MLSEIPNDVILQILKECVPKAVFLSVVYNGEKFEITANLTIDGSSILDQWDSIHFKKYQLCHAHLQRFFQDADFEVFDVQSLLVTSRQRISINADSIFVNWLWRFIIKHTKSLQSISLKYLNFVECTRSEWSCLIGTLRMQSLRNINKLMFESCHFPKRSQAYNLTAEEEDINEDCPEIEEANRNLLIDFLENRLQYMDITSATYWIPHHFMEFVTTWCHSLAPKIFKHWSVMKNGDFQSITNALSRHPNLARIDEPLIYGQTLVFKNSHNPDAQLHIYVERPLYIWIAGIHSECIDGPHGIISFKRDSGCSITITGGTEVGHASGTYSHYNGWKLDVQINSCVTGYIEKSFTKVNSDHWRQPSSGYIFYDEVNHWDCCFNSACTV